MSHRTSTDTKTALEAVKNGTRSGVDTPVSSDGSVKSEDQLLASKDFPYQPHVLKSGLAGPGQEMAEHSDRSGKMSPVSMLYSGSEISERGSGWYIWMITALIALGSLQFGFDTGIISGVLVNIGSDLGHPLTNGNKEFITSATTAGAFMGGLAAGVASDKLGRKWLLGGADAFFVLGSVLQAVAHNMGTMVAGRWIIGLGVGMASCVCPLLISELAPTHLRGRLVTINVLGITFGQVVAYGIGAAFENSAGGWRWMCGICAIPGGIQLLAIFLLPDSPRQLIVWGQLEKAQKSLSKIYPYDSPVESAARVKAIASEARESAEILASHPFKKRLRAIVTQGSNRRALIIACGLQLLQQLCGWNTLMYYSSTLFASIGFNNPTAVGLIVSGTNFLGTLFALKFIDIIGRRRILIFTVPGMAFGLVLAGICFHFLTKGFGGVLDPSNDYPKTWSGLILFSIVFYAISYSTGIGSIPWLQSELFPAAYRGIGSSIATGCNWSANLVIGSTYLTLMDAITPTGAFSLYGGICVVFWFFIIFCYPETAGLDIEETQVIFRKNFGIKASEQLRAEKKAAVKDSDV